MYTKFVYKNSLYLLCLALLITACSPNSPRHRKITHHRKDKPGMSREGGATYRALPKSKATEKKAAEALMAFRLRIVEDAKSYKGVPYRYGGKLPETGFDCSGFAGFIFTKAGLPLSGPSHAQAKLGVRKERADLQPGDLIFFGSPERISHVAIVTQNREDVLEIVHATTTSGVRIENMCQSKYWTSRYLYGVDILAGFRDLSAR